MNKKADIVTANRAAFVASLAATVLITAACASSPTQPQQQAAQELTPETSAEMTGAANDTSTAERAYSREYRDCLRRVRRTGSRLARSECEASIFGGAYHSDNEKKTAEPGSVNVN